MILRLAGRWLGALFIATLIGCGGGGGGGGQARNAVLSLNKSTLGVSARTDGGAPYDSSVVISIDNLPDDGAYVELEYSGNGIYSADFAQVSDSEATMQLAFKEPSSLGPGSYVDQIRVSACYDENCSRLVSGSPALLDVTYTVESPTTMTLSRSYVSTVASLGGDAPATESVTVSFDTVSSSGVFVSVSVDQDSESIIESANLVTLSPTQRRVDIRFKDPDQVGASNPTGFVRVEACYDNPCTQGVVDGSRYITVQYRVSQFPIAATRSFELGANDMVFDPVNARFYLALPSAAPAHPNTLSAFNPVSGAVVASASAGSEPKVVAVSGDGSKVYVALGGADQVKRFSAPALTQDLTITVAPSNPFSGERTEQMAVSPGAPNSVALSIGNQVRIYDGALARAGVVGDDESVTANTVEWGSSSAILYSNNNRSTLGELCVIDVTVAGAALHVAYPGVLDDFAPRIHYDAGLIYSDRGEVIDPASGSTVGTFVDDSSYAFFRVLELDSARRLAFMATEDFSDPQGVVRIRVFDMDSYVLGRTVEIDGVDGDPKRLLRWGDDGMALLTTTGQLLLFNGPLVTDPASP